MELGLTSLWENNCLICLQESEYKMLVINDKNGSTADLFEKIVRCTNFQITELKNTMYPSKICRTCYLDLIAAYRIITLSEHSKNKLEILHKKLRQYVQRTKDESMMMCDTNTMDICKNCNESEMQIKNELELDSESNLIYYEEHISSDFENDNDDYMMKNKVNYEESKTIENIFEEAKQKALERQSKDKFQKSICDLCGNYYSQNQLKYHRMRHDKVKKFPCEICERRFATETDLRRHMRVHTGEKPYGCKYCERKFSDYGSRVKHERFHTGERPYACKTCSKSFTYSHALKKHQSVHTGFKEFLCQICSTGFTKKEYLQNHMRRHKIDKNPNNADIILHEPKNTEMLY